MKKKEKKTKEKKTKKDHRGGARPGAGRPKQNEKSKLFSFRATDDMVDLLETMPQRSEFIKRCIRKEMEKAAEPDFSQLGVAYPATSVKEQDVHFFDIGIVAGFPIPLDNDEKAERIELLQMLCPHPEASYLIRVQGNSMIDANIHSGDIVIVDKSNRNPSPSEVAVCELNGEYTLKRFEMRGDEGWLIPANPEFPEIRVTETDSFRIWGTVTFVIHKPI